METKRTGRCETEEKNKRAYHFVTSTTYQSRNIFTPFRHNSSHRRNPTLVPQNAQWIHPTKHTRENERMIFMRYLQPKDKRKDTIPSPTNHIHLPP